MIIIYCSLCSEIKNIEDDNNLFYKFIKEKGLSTRIIYETNNFVVMPTIGSFVEGYIMIVTKEHYTSMGSIQPEMFDELFKLLETCKRVIKKIYNKNSIVFEHGAISSCRKNGGCIDHAHVHIIPIDNGIEHQLKIYPVKLIEIKSLHDLKEMGQNNTSYLFYQNTLDENYLIEADITPSQFLRQLSSKELNVFSKWDWRKYPEINNLILTLENVTTDVFKNYDL